MSARVSRAQPSRGLLDRVASTFVAPAEVSEPAVVTAPATIAVLCRADDAWVVGSAVALAGRGPAVVIGWGEGLAAPVSRAPGTRVARRLAARLGARGHEAIATGRLVHAWSDDPCVDGARIAAAADPARCVTVLAGPRDDTIDALLRVEDTVLVDADDEIADLALTSLAQADVAARRIAIAGAPATARALAAAGIALLPPLRGAIDEAVR